jgi:hypothetical protein
VVLEAGGGGSALGQEEVVVRKAGEGGRERLVGKRHGGEVAAGRGRWWRVVVMAREVPERRKTKLGIIHRDTAMPRSCRGLCRSGEGEESSRDGWPSPAKWTAAAGRAEPHACVGKKM